MRNSIQDAEQLKDKSISISGKPFKRIGLYVMLLYYVARIGRDNIYLRMLRDGMKHV